MRINGCVKILDTMIQYVSELLLFLRKIIKYFSNTSLNTQLAGYPLASQSATTACLVNLMSTTWISETVMECGLDYLKVSLSLIETLIDDRQRIQISGVKSCFNPPSFGNPVRRLGNRRRCIPACKWFFFERFQ